MKTVQTVITAVGITPNIRITVSRNRAEPCLKRLLGEEKHLSKGAVIGPPKVTSMPNDKGIRVSTLIPGTR